MSDEKSLLELYAAAWCDVKQPDLDGVNPHYRSRYATLAAVQGCIRKACAKHGIAYAQRVKPRDDGVTVTSLIVGGGEQVTLSVYPVQIAPNNPQASGSALTYAKRQLASIDWGICGDDDDDGQGAAQHRPGQVKPANPMDAYRAALVRAKSRGVTIQDAMARVSGEVGKPPDEFGDADIARAVEIVDAMRPSDEGCEVESF